MNDVTGDKRNGCLKVALATAFTLITIWLLLHLLPFAAVLPAFFD